MGKHDHADVVKVERLPKHGGPCLAVCTGKHCARAGAKQVIRAAQATLDEAGIGDAVTVTLTECQDYCDDGPSMTVFPGAYPYIELDAESVRQVVFEHVRDGQPVLNRLHKRMRRKLERRMARAEGEDSQ